MISWSFVVASAYLCTATDPSDALIKDHKYDPALDEYYEAMCTLCNAYVRPTSKHCSVCNRCTSEFDHHCKWINNCIGGLNYRVFILMIVSLESNLLISAVAELIIIAYLSSNSAIFMIITIDLVASLLILVLNGNLIAFHIYLYVKRITTYEYILERRKKKS